MYKYVVDTNVLYGLAFNDEIHCITENAFNVLKGNIGIVTYGTLFEAFDRYRNQKESLQKILRFLNEHKFEVTGNSEKDDELFWTLMYGEKELSDIGLMTLKKLLIIQTSDYVSRVLGQILNAFAVLYMNMRLNKEDDAYNMYVRYAAFVTDGFAHFPVLVRDVLEKAFTASYSQEESEKFYRIVRREFWGVIRSIEVPYAVLAGKPENSIEENDFEAELEEATKKFDLQYNENDYLDFMKKAAEQMATGEKLLTSESDLFSNISYQQLTPLETDFLRHCLQRLFVNKGKFSYNDIIDFMNISAASRYADGILTCDNDFKKMMGQFASIKDTSFYQDTLRLSDYISK